MEWIINDKILRAVLGLLLACKNSLNCEADKSVENLGLGPPWRWSWCCCRTWPRYRVLCRYGSTHVVQPHLWLA